MSSLTIKLDPKSWWEAFSHCLE